MFETLMNNSISIVFVVAICLLAITEFRRYLQQTGKSSKEVRSSVREKFTLIGNELLIKLVASAIITIIISGVSFRELWMNDGFHIVFITNLLYKPTVDHLKRLFE